jgi:NAD(P)-dependent dehydrogenase (short-subunit alcohol dehydrogenase family)
MTGAGPSASGREAMHPPNGRLAGRVALITGASHGIGRAVALTFVREGAEVVLVGRTQGALEEVDNAIRALGGHASLVVADLRDGAVIDRMGAAVFERWGRLDVLVGNAGVLGVLTPLGHLDPAVWDEVIAVNLTANWRLIRSFDPLLRAAPAGRAVFVTSGVAAGRAYWGAYAVSKGAVETLARTYAHEVAKTTVRVNVINPGATRTRMRAQAFPGEDPQSLKPADDDALMEVFVSLAEPACARNGETVSL